MKYIDAIKVTAIAFIAIVFITYMIDGIGPSSEVELVLTISTFLFAILTGFFIARLSSRFDSIRITVAEEDAKMLSLYRTSEAFGKQFSNKVATEIDSYYIISYDFSLSDSDKATKANGRYITQLWKLIHSVKKKDPSGAYQNMMGQMTAIELTRKKAAAISKEKLGAGQWTTLILLTGIILTSVNYIKTDSLYSIIISILLATILVLVLLIMRDLQNLMLGGVSLLEESGQLILEEIGKQRYYNEYFIKKGISTVPKDITAYRVGTHKPGSHTFKIKKVKT